MEAQEIPYWREYLLGDCPGCGKPQGREVERIIRTAAKEEDAVSALAQHDLDGIEAGRLNFDTGCSLCGLPKGTDRLRPLPPAAAVKERVAEVVHDHAAEHGDFGGPEGIEQLADRLSRILFSID